MDPYKILDIRRDATPDEIRQAFLRMAKKHHPDSGGDAWAFQLVRQAYEKLAGPTPTDGEIPPPPPFSRQQIDAESAPSRRSHRHYDPFHETSSHRYWITFLGIAAIIVAVILIVRSRNSPRTDPPSIDVTSLPPDDRMSPAAPPVKATEAGGDATPDRSADAEPSVEVPSSEGDSAAAPKSPSKAGKNQERATLDIVFTPRTGKRDQAAGSADDDARKSQADRETARFWSIVRAARQRASQVHPKNIRERTKLMSELVTSFQQDVDGLIFALDCVVEDVVADSREGIFDVTFSTSASIPEGHRDAVTMIYGTPGMNRVLLRLSPPQVAEVKKGTTFRLSGRLRVNRPFVAGSSAEDAFRVAFLPLVEEVVMGMEGLRVDLR